jgi:hypothetical protein
MWFFGSRITPTFNGACENLSRSILALGKQR